MLSLMDFRSACSNRRQNCEKSAGRSPTRECVPRTPERSGGRARDVPKGGHLVKCDKGFHELGNRGVNFLRRLCPGDLVDGLSHGGGDSRVLDRVEHDARGVRHKPLSAAVGCMWEEPLQDFPLENKRGFPWLLVCDGVKGGCRERCVRDAGFGGLRHRVRSHL